MNQKKSDDDQFELNKFVDMLASHANSEMSELQKLSIIAKHVEAKLAEIYREKFPKTCNACGRVYKTRDEYLEATNPIGPRGIRWDDIVDKVQEYRNCVCGSTLLLMVPDRRDMTPFGIERRRLFDVFVAKIVELTGDPQSDVANKVRAIFRGLAKKVSDEEN